MKKTLLVFLAIALVSSFAFAEAVVGGDASISGSVSLTAGYDLDNEGYGFVNDSDIQITLPILGGDAGASGDDGIYAEILIDEIGWEWNYDEGGFYDTFDESDAVYASISATVYFNSFYLGLGAPDFEVQNVDIEDDDYAFDAHADAELATGGFSLGFKNDTIDIALMVASERDWKGDEDDIGVWTDTDTDDNNFFINGTDGQDDSEDYEANDGNLVFGVSATIDPAEGVTIPVTFLFDPSSDAVVGDAYTPATEDGGTEDSSTGLFDEDLIAFGIAPSVESGDLTFDFPFDYVSYGDDSAFEMEPAVTYAVMEGFDVAASLLYGSYDFVGLDLNAVVGVTVTLTDTEAFVPGLEWMLEVEGSDLGDYTDSGLDVLPVTIEAEASYNMDGMKPYMSTSYDLLHQDMELGLGVELSADFTGIDNTVITLDYANDSIMNSVNDEYPGDDDFTEDGRVTLDITVSF